MKTSNICKIINTEPGKVLNVKHFIRETDKDVMQNSHAFHHHRAILITSSETRFFINNEEEFLLNRGDLIFLFKGEYLKSIPSDEGEYMYVSFDGSRADTLFSRFGISKLNRLFRENQNMIPFWNDCIFKAAENADLVAESVLIYTFSRLSAPLAPADNAVNKAQSLIEEYFADPTLNLTSVAKQLGYNQKYLSQIFKKAKNIGISDYIRNLRLQHAVFLFDHGIDSVKSVSSLSGFKDPYHFSNVFKDAIGMSPSEYKNKKQSK